MDDISWYIDNPITPKIKHPNNNTMLEEGIYMDLHIFWDHVGSVYYGNGSCLFHKDTSAPNHTLPQGAATKKEWIHDDAPPSSVCWFITPSKII